MCLYCLRRYHGFQYRVLGFLSRRRHHMTRGLQMHEAAERERRRERDRRQRRLADEGAAIRMGASKLIRSGSRRTRGLHRHGSGYHRHRSSRSRSRSRHHSNGHSGRYRDGSAVPIVHSTADNREVFVSPAPSTRYVDTANSHVPHSGGYGYHSQQRSMPVLRSIHSRNHAYYDDGGVPIVRSISTQDRIIPDIRSAPHSPYAHSNATGLARSTSSYHGRHYS